MRAKQYFLQVAATEKKLKLLQAKIRHFEDLGLSISSGNSSTIGGRQAGASRVEMAVVGKVDSQRTMEEQRDAYFAQIREAENIIDEIPQEKYRQILTLRYLCDWSLKSISDELRYKDPNSVYRAHGWALAAAQKVLNKRKI